MIVTQVEIQHAIHVLGLAQRAVCVHASLRSFGQVEGGERTIINAFLEEQCTLLVPSFSWSFAVPPPPDQQFPRNGWDYAAYPGPTTGVGRSYRSETNDIDKAMGALGAAVVATPGRVRGDHPIGSFTALGSLAAELIAGQQVDDMFAPLATLARLGGAVLLMGVGLNSLTLLHLAEKKAGRTMFRRWANDATGNQIAVEVGACSDGFPKLAPVLQPLIQTITVGQSGWMLLPAAQALATATAAIRVDPMITHCGNPRCGRCNDAVAGGPLLPT